MMSNYIFNCPRCKADMTNLWVYMGDGYGESEPAPATPHYEGRCYNCQGRLIFKYKLEDVEEDKEYNDTIEEVADY